MRKIVQKLIPLAALILVAEASLSGAGADLLKPDAAAMQRWQDMRFGMFIHWGPVSLTGQEIGWSRGDQTPIEEYDKLYQRFNPAHFDPEAWARVAKAAGMKYVVLTTKHHDGFCLWDTKLTGFNIMNSPLHRDVVKELADACRKQGLAFGTYYSTCDWHHPDFPLTSPGGRVKREKSDLDAYNRYLLGQVSELITNYGPLITIWNDVPQLFAGRGTNTIKLVRTLQPDILINNRTGDGGDYDTPEQRVGKFQNDRPWETCMTICRQWSWKPNDTMKSLAQCLQTLVTCAGGDGNLLFNVGPTPDGVIEPRQVDRLKEMGAWLQKNGESIYGTRGGPWKPGRGLASTRKGNVVYLHVLKPAADPLVLPAPGREIKSARVLGGRPLKVRQTGREISIPLAPADRQEIDTIVKLELAGSAMDLAPISLLPEIGATASAVYQKSPAYAAAMAVDGDEETRWATDSGTKQAWLAVDYGKPRSFSSVEIHEVFDRVTRFEFQYKAGNEWKTLFAGTTVGEHFSRTFPAVTAREFRLNILDAKDGPTISEIALHGPPP